MAIEKLCSDKFIDGKKYAKHKSTTHIRVEGDNFVQYRINPSPEPCMIEVVKETTEFIAYEKIKNNHVFSRVIEAIGSESPKTYHYHVG